MPKLPLLPRRLLSQAASVWPLGENVHFAWSEDGEALQKSAGKMIVDGVDCGRMALEDSLERKNGEIMVRADRYLMVPVSLEAELLAGLTKCIHHIKHLNV